MTIKPATRQGVKPLIGIYSESGCGKTYSSLLLARGLVGPTGKIVMVDTESGRGSLYADVLPDGYDVLQLEAPFSPARYVEAIETVEQSGALVGIIDSGSHEWEGLEGVLSMAGDNEAKSGRPGLHNWRVPKMEHAKFTLKLLQSPLPWIICLRAKFKTRQAKNDKGKTEIVKDDYTTPIQADDFIFECTAHAEVMQDHSFRLTKCSHPALRGCFPENRPIEIKHGESLAKWCASPSTTQDERQGLVAELWRAVKPIRGQDSNWLATEIWLSGNGMMDDAETVKTMTAQRLKEILAKVKAHRFEEVAV